jgi:LuxR family maltose regulon positive regulatory protein
MRSKVTSPALRPGIIERSALVDDLLSSAHTAVVLVSAPAGYGKSTLLALWQQRDERPFAWVCVERGDDDPVVFVASLVASLDPIIRAGEKIREALRAPGPPLEDFILPALVEVWAQASTPLVLVLDNLDRMTGKRSHSALRYLIENLPPGCQIALATRTDPPLPVASLRAHGRLVEIRTADLALDDKEAGALFLAADVHLADEQVARLTERTEGWAAGLYLTALSLRDRTQPEEFISRFTGTNRHVADFFSEDVLGRQRAEVVDFLLHTCVLEELTAPLCRAMTGGSDAAMVLEDLEHGNLFVVPQDEDRRAYRYHHLFAEYLCAELARREPELVPELHRRACGWYREHGVVGRAIAHARAAGYLDTATELVAAEATRMINDGMIETVLGWLDGFEQMQIESHPPLAIAAAWVLALNGDPKRAAIFTEAAKRGSWDGPLPDGTSSLESGIAIISSAFGFEGISGMRCIAQRAVDLEPAPNRHRATGLQLLGIAQTLGGDFDDARVVLAEACRLAGDTSIGALCLSYLALIDLWEGNEDEALVQARRAYAIVELPRMRGDLSSIATYGVIAMLLAQRDETTEAERAIERVNAILPRVTEAFWWMMIQARILLALGLHAIGREEEAGMRLDEAETLLAVRPDAGILAKWYEKTRREIGQGDAPRSGENLSNAELRVLRLLASDLTKREIGCELLLSTNTVKSHIRSIYRKLGVSSRQDAIRAARAKT